MKRWTVQLAVTLLVVSLARAQDTVDVTFRYKAPSPNSWTLVGEFTNRATSGIPMSTVDNVNYVAIGRLLSTGQPGGFVSGGSQKAGNVA